MLTLLTITLSVGIALLVAPYEVARVEPRTMTQTELRTSTVLSTEILAITSIEFKTSTDISIATVQGEPPNVVIASQTWNPPVLTLYLQNFGGSGTITLLVFVNGYSGRQKFHIRAYDSLTLNIRFPTYPYSQAPTAQIISQEADLVVQTQTIEIPYGKTHTHYSNRTLISELLRTSTQLFITSTTVKELKRILDGIVGAPTEPYVPIVIFGSIAIGASGIALFAAKLGSKISSSRKVTPKVKALEKVISKPYGIRVLVEDAKKAVRFEVEPQVTINSIIATIMRELKLPKRDYSLVVGDAWFGKDRYALTLDEIGVKEGDTLELRSDKAEYERYLNRLDELKAQGKIGEKVYEKLKKRYQAERV